MASAAEQLAANLNFGALAKADELKKRIWFTLGALIIYRLGTYIPLPGMNPEAVADLFRQSQGGVLGLFTAIPLVFSHVLFKDWIAKFEIRVKASSQKLITLVTNYKKDPDLLAPRDEDDEDGDDRPRPAPRRRARAD